MRRVALVIPELRMGGAQRVMLAIGKGVAERGHSVDLVVGRAEGELECHVPDTVRLCDLAVSVQPRRSFGFTIEFLWRLTEYLRTVDPDVILTTLTGTNLVTVVARSAAHSNARLILREACSLKNVRGFSRSFGMRLLYRRADQIVAVTEALRSELLSSLNLEPNRVTAIPNPIDADGIRSAASEPCEHAWVREADLPLVVSVGRLTAQKDHATLLVAFAGVLRRMSARLIVVGEGEERRRLEKLIEDLGIGSSVLLVGFDANPWRWLARSDLYVMSSRWEGHPNTLLEAKAIGLPMVCTRYDDSVADLLGEQDLIVPVADPQALAAGIVESLRRAPHERTAWHPANTVNRYVDLLEGHRSGTIQCHQPL